MNPEKHTLFHVPWNSNNFQTRRREWSWWVVYSAVPFSDCELYIVLNAPDLEIEPDPSPQLWQKPTTSVLPCFCNKPMMTRMQLNQCAVGPQKPVLLRWINVNLSIDWQSHVQQCVGWNYLSIKTSEAPLMKLGNGQVIAPHTLWWIWLHTYEWIKDNHGE